MLGNKLHTGGLAENVYFAGSGNSSEIYETINTYYSDKCPAESLVLVGYSRGAITVQDTAAFLQRLNPAISIDLMITIAPVAVGSAGFASPENRKPNVKRHVNIISGQGFAGVDPFIFRPLEGEPSYNVWPGSMVALPELRIKGVDREEVIEQTHHFGVMLESMPSFKKLNPPPASRQKGGHEFIREVFPNPVWLMVEEEFRLLPMKP